MICDLFHTKKKKIAVLIDPEKITHDRLLHIIRQSKHFDFFFVGGSLLAESVEPTIAFLKSHTRKPVIIFPGSHMQLSKKADAVLFLSLISGRNPEYLISQHVAAAQFIKKHRIETISTGYILIDGGKTSSTEYVSNTKPIPAEKTDLVVSTALAGEMLGFKCIYLEAGSGAVKSVPTKLISEVRKNITVPIIVGGGIRSNNEIQNCWKAGADIVVIGNGIEKNPDLLKSIKKF
jgi:phosphoglycerol geranylgeranyltransferase